MEERLQKILAQAGYGSRRTCEELIAQGRVSVNGRVAILGTKAAPATDRITVDGKTIRVEEQQVYIALNKPRGVVSAAASPEGRQTVRDLVPAKERLYPVGRLDVDSEGLILLTNDGELANHLTHPRYEHEKEYRVLVARHPDPDQLEAWRRGVVLDENVRTLPAQVSVEELSGKGAWLRVVLKEGKKRQIREVGDRIGLPIVRIQRVRIGSLRLGRLAPGQWRYLSASEVAELKREPGKTVNRPPKTKPGSSKSSASPKQPERVSVRDKRR